MKPSLLFIQVESLAVLAKSDALDQAAAYAAVEGLLKFLRTTPTQDRTSRVNIGVPPDAAQMGSFGSHARQAILESLNSGNPAELRRIQRVLDQRWGERSSDRAPAYSIEDIEYGWNEQQQAFNAKAVELTRAAESRHADADSAYQEWERSISTTERRLSNQDQQRTQDKTGFVLSSPFAIAAGAAAAFGALAKIGGQGLSAVAFMTLVGALLGMCCGIVMRIRTKSAPTVNSAASRLSRQMLRPAADALIRHYQSREQAVHYDLECNQIQAVLGDVAATCDALRDTELIATETVNRFGRGRFQPIDEGKVLLVGSDLVRELVAHRDHPAPPELFRQILTTFRGMAGFSLAEAARKLSSTELFQQLTIAAVAHAGSVSLAETVKVVNQTAEGKKRLWEILETLHRAASSSVRLKRGLEFELDHTLSPANWMFGLPGGPEDPLAAVVLERFPDANFFHSFDTEAIEIYFDHRNLSRTHLLWDEISRDHYDQAPVFERQTQWHFPRRWRGGAEVASIPDQMPTAV